MVTHERISPQVKAQRRIERFLQHYEDEALRRQALQFAQYAAFPLTLTSELCFLLREEFTPDLPWYVATDLLLSGLCESVGYDLYEMETTTQNYLRSELATYANLDPVAQFLANYIAYRLTQETSQRSEQLGKPAEWIAMACLKSADEVTLEIKKQLLEVLRTAENPSDRFRLAAMVENVGDLLAQRGYEPIDLREIQACLEEGEPIDEWDALRKELLVKGFPELKPLNIEYATLVFSTHGSAQAEGERSPFSFETVTVDRKGQEIRRETHTADQYIETLPEKINLEMVAIPSGQFKMGSPDSEHERYEDEGPVHDVTVQPFFLGKYPITQAQWQIVANLPPEQRPLDITPSSFQGNDHPIETVSWEEATEFCLRLSKATGRTYRLPSEAEWEYACRAGTQTPFHCGETITGNLANYDSSYTYRQEKEIAPRNQTTPVGQFPPNKFGLYDMHGNVWEWCQDHWHRNYQGAPTNGYPWLSENENDYHLLRGGSWNRLPGRCRSALRDFNSPGYRYNLIGFRVVCEAARTL